MIWKSSARSPYDLKIISQVPLWFENHQPGPPMIWKSSARSPYDLKIISQVPLWFENHQPGPPMIWKSSARSPYDLKIISQVPLWFENHQPGPPMIWKSSARSPYHQNDSKAQKKITDIAGLWRTTPLRAHQITAAPLESMPTTRLPSGENSPRAQPPSGAAARRRWRFWDL